MTEAQIPQLDAIPFNQQPLLELLQFADKCIADEGYALSTAEGDFSEEDEPDMEESILPFSDDLNKAALKLCNVLEYERAPHETLEEFFAGIEAAKEGTGIEGWYQRLLEEFRLALAAHLEALYGQGPT